MSPQSDLSTVRRDFGDVALSEDAIKDCPIEQFQLWLTDALALEAIEEDATAMVLSTVDDGGCPDSRVVLLKHIENGHFIFYTNYLSIKGEQIEKTPCVAINFYWKARARQVRIRGSIQRVSEAQSDAYFASRPLESQLGALASRQSQPITSRADLEQAFNSLLIQYQNKPIPRPDCWGGYQVSPTAFEFWQGRNNRLHDRIAYSYQDGTWFKHRLAP